MTNNYEELIEGFEAKFRKLILEYESLKSQNASLQLELKREHEQLVRAHKDFADMKDNFDHLRVARYLNDSPKERKISKQYINNLVREIDKCLALLDE